MSDDQHSEIESESQADGREVPDVEQVEQVELVEQEVEEDAPTPFDNPFFLPVILWGLAAWFGFDIVTNAQAYQDYPNFNRGGFAVLSVAAIYFTRSAILEKRAMREQESESAR